MEEIDQTSIPVVEDSALNERMYGSLQGLNKAATIEKYGEGQVEKWRRSYTTRPPDGESLEDTYNRVLPFYKKVIEPGLKKRENILIVAHGNSLRALMMYLENIAPKEIESVNIPTGLPRQYIFDPDLHITSNKYI